ncbi:hypothetical protein PBAL39_05908 [Pedobacter sp. BAL39]|nr:hypothetical protein PBAL39_05908 [Pedobacter sp. BAL39]
MEFYSNCNVRLSADYTYRSQKRGVDKNAGYVDDVATFPGFGLLSICGFEALATERTIDQPLAQFFS